MKFSKFTLFLLVLCFVFSSFSNADPLEEANAAIKNEDFAKAQELLAPLVEENNAEALAILGALYINGQGVEKDFNKGQSMIMKAAMQDYKPARIMAYKLCIDLGNQGDTAAMYNVGYMCLNGWVGEADNNTCLAWLENAGKMGHEKSLSFLSKIYTKGMFGISPDVEKSNYWNNLKAAYAEGINGKWLASISMGPSGPPMEVTYNLKAEGDILTGTTVGGGKEMEIKDGKIDGQNFSFNVESVNQGMKSTFKYSGFFRGDTLKITMVSDMGLGGPAQPTTFDAKRAE